MKIIFLALSYPNIEQTTNLYTDLMEEFNKNGHEITVIAPSDKKKTYLNKEGNINVLRVKTGKLFNTNLIRKGLNNILLPYHYLIAIKRNLDIECFDLIIIPTPPITLYSVTKWVKKRSNSKVYLILRDIFPQNAVDLGMISKHSFLYKHFRKKEKKLYELSDSIGCMSDGNIQFVIKYNREISRSKLHLLPNWEKINENIVFKPDEVETIKNQFKLNGKYVALFGGNIGKPQELENIIYLAKSIEYLEDVLFIIIGDGTEKEALKNLIKTLKVRNVRVMDTISRIEFNKLLYVCHVGLISLNKHFSIPNIPSKTLAYFNFKKPILASIDKNTDYNLLLEDSKSGLYSYAGDIESFKRNFLKLYDNEELRKNMGEYGNLYLKKYLSPSIAYEKIINHV